MVNAECKDSESGMAAVELALVMPLLLLLIFGMYTIGMALYTKHQMASFVQAAARRCALADASGPSDCNSKIQKLLESQPSVRNWLISQCSDEPFPTSTKEEIDRTEGGDRVWAWGVQLSCQFVGGFQGELLGDLSITRLSASALVPY